MAKILLVCEKINHTTWQLARALKAQQHEVHFLTHQDEQIDSSEGIEILSYFKNWSAFEAGRLMPTLLALRPHIIHFVLEDDRVTPAHLLIWAYSQSQPSIVFTISLLNIKKGLSRRNWVRYLIQHSDIITCPSVDALAHLRGIDIKTPRQGRSLLPPVLTGSEGTHEAENFEIEEFLDNEKFLIRPFSEPHFDSEKPFFTSLLEALKKYKVVLFGNQNHWSVRERKLFQKWLEEEGVSQNWFLTGDRSLEDLADLLKKAEGLWLADLDLTPMELTEYYIKTLDSSSTLILDPKQARLHAPLWQEGRNCWIVHNGDYKTIFSKETLRLDYQLDRLSLDRKDLIDAPLNELNRLYNKALSQKANL